MGAVGQFVARHGQRRFSVRAAALLWLLISSVSSIAHAADINVIVNADHSSVTLDRALLRSFFTMRSRQWPDGEPVHVFVLPDTSDIHDAFCREQLGIYPYVLRNTWDRLVFTGTGFAPEVVRSESEMRQKIKTTPGAIGYVRSANVTSTQTQTKEISHEK